MSNPGRIGIDLAKHRLPAACSGSGRSRAVPQKTDEAEAVCIPAKIRNSLQETSTADAWTAASASLWERS